MKVIIMSICILGILIGIIDITDFVMTTYFRHRVCFIPWLGIPLVICSIGIIHWENWARRGMICTYLLYTVYNIYPIIKHFPEYDSISLVKVFVFLILIGIPIFFIYYLSRSKTREYFKKVKIDSKWRRQGIIIQAIGIVFIISWFSYGITMMCKAYSWLDFPKENMGTVLLCFFSVVFQPVAWLLLIIGFFGEEIGREMKKHK